MIPLDSFMANSADGKLVPVLPGGHNIPLTFYNRTDYVERALEYRLHEMDRQVLLLNPLAHYAPDCSLQPRPRPVGISGRPQCAQSWTVFRAGAYINNSLCAGAKLSL